jgi:DNA-binding transcriptional MocR family regulator
VIQRLARLKTATDLGSSPITQAIAVRLIRATDEARQLRHHQLKPRRDRLASLLQDRLPDWRFRLPAGGLFLWVRLPDGDAREYAQVALRHGVVALPGSTMSADEEHRRFLRLTFVASPETLKAGVIRLSAAWRNYRSTKRPSREHTVMV